MDRHGVIALVPAASVIALALLTRRTLESLLGGTLLGFVLVGGWGFLGEFTDSLLRVMQDPTIAWVLLVCGLFGSLIRLLVSAGGADAFADALAARVQSRRAALLATWGLGLAIFIDDYLNALTVGSAMRRVTDRFGVPREMLAYVVDSTAAPVCVLLPLSTWAIYVGGLLEGEGLAAVGAGLNAYLEAVPYMFYGWVAIALVPLAAVGWLPPLGGMRAAERRAAAGMLAPPGSPADPDGTGTGFALREAGGQAAAARSPESPRPTVAAPLDLPRLACFVLPLLLLIIATVATGIDALKGVIIALGVTSVAFAVFRILPPARIGDDAVAGFASMLQALAIVVLSFMLKEVNDRLGLSEFVLDAVAPWMAPALLPALAFLSLSLLAFTTGSFWGVYAIAFPILVPLAVELGVSPPLTVAAVVSAGAFGSHACFYGDATVLSARAAGCDTMAHVTTQLPYAVLGGAISTGLFLLAGWLTLG